jgi:hypothetical protein
MPRTAILTLLLLLALGAGSAEAKRAYHAVPFRPENNDAYSFTVASISPFPPTIPRMS